MAGPLIVDAGATFTGTYRRIDDLVGDNGPHLAAIMEFTEEAAVRIATTGPEHQAVAAHRNNAFEHFGTVLAAAPPAG